MRTFKGLQEVIRELKKAHKYYYKPHPVKAKKMSQPFKVEISPGHFLSGKAGDYLVLDRNGVRIIKEEKFEEVFQDVDATPLHLVLMNDINRTVLNMSTIAKYFISLSSNLRGKSILLTFSLPGRVERITLHYEDVELLKKERDFLEGLIRKYRIRELANLEIQAIKAKFQNPTKRR